MLNKKIIILIVLSLFLIGCRTAPIQDITDAPINTASGEVPSLSLIAREIVEAGSQLGWQMKKMKPGHIIGTLYLRTHMVKVDIAYTQTNYSITYNDSSKMNYDGENIHSNYNSWLQNLSNMINSQVFNATN
ncbi:MAG: hypothetical protein OQL19_03705 [Gammaproteobacteria bacterium]|nr:hypothetical protein [Gammaproteobacteria bacterium]